MERAMTTRLILFLLMIIATGLNSCSSCSDSGDSESIGQALEDRLTDALDFEGGQMHEEEVPGATSDDSSPQISNIEAPDQFHVDAPFEIELATQFDKARNINAAVIHVVGASAYIRVKKSMVQQFDVWLMELNGRLTEDAELKGNTFTIEYALQNTAGRTGSYKTKQMLIAEEDAACNKGDCCNGGQWLAEGEDCASGEDALACTADLCDSEHHCQSSLSADWCLIEDICFELDQIGPDYPCKRCSPGDDQEWWTWLEDHSPCSSEDFEGSGECIEGECMTTDSDGDSEHDVDGDTHTDGDSDEEIDGDSPDGDRDQENSEDVEEPEEEAEAPSACEPNPCMNEGICEEGDSLFSCLCTLEYGGETCEECSLLAHGVYPDCIVPSGAQHWPVLPTNMNDCMEAAAVIDCSLINGGTMDPPTCGDAPPIAYCGQDAHYGGNARNFDCRDDQDSAINCANALAADEVAIDSLTGLTWQRNLPATYPDCGADSCTWGDALNYCDNLNYANISDWRLPSYHELQSLLSYHSFSGGYDATVFQNLGDSFYWSASVSAFQPSESWSVQFGNTYMLYYPPSNTHKVICVTGEGPAQNTGFVESGATGQEVVEDIVTGLIWQKGEIVDLTWVDALSVCEASDHAGETDWRLPNQNELISLVDSNRFNPASAFPGMSISTQEVWTSTPVANDVVWAWRIDFRDGSSFYADKTSAFSVYCVRN